MKMSLWLIRGGSHGEYESKFIEENKVFLTWGELTATDMTSISDYDGIRVRLNQFYPNDPVRRIGNWSGQVWAFVGAMKIGDWVVLPRKSKATISICEITSNCKFQQDEDLDYRHFREIKWIATDLPRSNFDQDILYSFGAFLTICEIRRNDAEARVRAMERNNWKSLNSPISTQQASIKENSSVMTDSEEIGVDLEELARDSIAKLIIQKFKGHGMARLVDAILRAQGFTTFLSPEGPDKGIDILAGSGAFGFENPKICVQVKSGDNPADHPEFMHLIGAMQSVQAEFGLFVSWSDFKHTVNREEAAKFFKVRLWNQNDLVNQLLSNYDKLDHQIQAEIPLKRIWMVANQGLLN